MSETQKTPDHLPATVPDYALAGPARGPTFWSTIDTRSQFGKSLLVKCLTGKDQSGDEVINTELAIRDVVVHPVSFTDDETGELVEGLRCVLVTMDHKVIAFVSQGIYKSLCVLSDPAMYGPPPWPQGLRVKLIQVQTRNARRLYQLQPVVGDEPAKPPKK